MRYLESSPFGFGYSHIEDRKWQRVFGKKMLMHCAACGKTTEHYASDHMLFCATCERPFDELSSQTQPKATAQT
jgi:ribosomal protein L37AE/L43A